MSSSENLNDCHLGRSIIRRGCLKSLTTLLTDFPKYLLVPFCMYSRKYGTGLCTETIDVKNYEGMECSIANFPLHPKLYQHIQLFEYFFDHEQRSKVLKEALFFYARARGSRHQGEYILVVIVVVMFFTCHFLKSGRIKELLEYLLSRSF